MSIDQINDEIERAGGSPLVMGDDAAGTPGSVCSAGPIGPVNSVKSP